MLVTKIKMKPGCQNSDNLLEIDSIFIEDGSKESGYYKKETVHLFLKEHPGRIKVNVWPYPDVVPATSIYNEKYVKSSPNAFRKDNLLSLPRY